MRDNKIHHSSNIFNAKKRVERGNEKMSEVQNQSELIKTTIYSFLYIK